MGECRLELDWDLDVHDPSQLELDLDYAYPATSAAAFKVETFLVAPSALALNQTAYPKGQFLADLTHRMRVHPPELPGFGEGRVASLDGYAALGLDLGAKQLLGARAVQDAKLFAGWVNGLIKRVFSGDVPAEGRRFDEQLARAEGLFQAFRRRYGDRVRREPLLFDDAVREAVLGVEEYLSDRLESALARGSLAGHAGATTQLRMLRASDSSAEHPPLTDSANLEHHSYRQGLLKKFVSEPLYLGLREVRRDRLYRNLIAAGAAALAATFAEVARLQTATNMGAELSLRLLVFLGLAVVAYVFKDRLKDLAKEHLGQYLTRHLPERESVVSLQMATSDGEVHSVVVGHHHEAVSYLSSDRLPPELHYVWSRLSPDQGQRPASDVLCHAKAFTVAPGAGAPFEQARVGVRDILRLDVSDFLAHFDRPLREMALYDADRGCMLVQAAKVYYLDILLRLSTSGPDGEEVRIEAVRAVLDKGGLIRIDRPIPAGRYRRAA